MVEVRRKSNYELMRIVSMFMIIVWHILQHTNLIQNTAGGENIILLIIKAIIIVHVNSFILITGFFQCDKKMKFTKFLSINNSVWFYKAMYLIIFLVFGITEINKVWIYRMLQPINYFEYWFVAVYVLLYLISPILNTVINNVSKEKFKKIIILLFLIISVFACFTRQIAFTSQGPAGNLFGFILLYFIGAYLRKYPIEKNYIFKRIPNNLRILIFMFAIFFLAFLNILLYFFSANLIGLNSTLLNEIGLIIRESVFLFQTPIVIIQSVMYFMFFGSLDFKNKFINKIAPLTFGIYLVHENQLLYDVMYTKIALYINNSAFIFTLIKILGLAVIIFVVSAIIEFIRHKIFKFIYNLRISKKNRIWYQKYIKSLGININW